MAPGQLGEALLEDASEATPRPSWSNRLARLLTPLLATASFGGACSLWCRRPDARSRGGGSSQPRSAGRLRASSLLEETPVDDCEPCIGELWVMRHANTTCWDTVPYDAGKQIDCPLDQAGVGQGMRYGKLSKLFQEGLSQDDLVLVSPLARTRATIYYELLAAGLLTGGGAVPAVRMHTGLVEIGKDPGNIGTVTTEWSRNFTNLGWDRPEFWDGGQTALDWWNEIYAQKALVPGIVELQAWRSKTKQVVDSLDISPQSLASLPSLRSSMCSWACSHQKSKVVLVSHHLFMSELLCLDANDSIHGGRPFRVKDVAGFLRHLQEPFGGGARRFSGLKCSSSFSR